MHYLHTMIRVSNLDQSLNFFCHKLGLVETRRTENEKGRFTLVFLAAPEDAHNAKPRVPVLELTYNWDPKTYTEGKNFGHLAFGVNDIYNICQKLMDQGIEINRPPRDGRMAFIKSPDGISIELLQAGQALPLSEPWVSMPNVGTW